ncbi:response regulator transcription factor [Bacterioplanoides sp. SCSIO 12839]|uniref:response regulator transcription factor n=1 Tax=Bacterioplanoides sp. SCSIO 12839 TaxID=2829569 RepID=UPI0021034A1F|nr:response regulator transcription factor [Bacterioplanoides sp. SCSIO 12839]UTW48157.1 response regulator transcription factor [Bacterioplanoides sp. SCSIO 12839]
MKVLHLDDHVLFTEGLKAVLSHQYGYDVHCANNMEQALGALTDETDFELILVDLTMPGLDGMAFIESLLERNVFIPFVVLSASEDLWAIRKAMEKGAAAFIPKAHSSQEIVSILQDVMAGNMYLPKTIEEGLASLPENEPGCDVHKLMASYRLGKRQMDVLKLMQQGYSTDDIAQVLNLSRNTIKTHTKTLFTSFNVNNRLECVRYAERTGLLNGVLK